MIYFDNAATGGFKPYSCTAAATDAMKNLNANAGRSGHTLARKAAEKVYSVRKKVAAFLGADTERVVFTQNCTDAANKALFGLDLKGKTVVTTCTEHNAVLRPLYELERRGDIKLKIIYPSSPIVTADDVAEALTDDTALVVMNAVSNVTGTANDVSGVGKLLENRNILFAVDAAQSAGHIPTDMKKDKIDVLFAAGHKGLLALQGVGVLAFSENADIRPTVFGGTGSDTFNEKMPDFYPERLEAGTMNVPAIASLGGGIDSLKDNLPYVSKQLTSLTEYLIATLAIKPYLRIYSTPNPVGIVSVAHVDVPSQELAGILSDKYDVATRGGFHCAPLIHKLLKTDKFGLLRVSLSPQNSRREIAYFANALDEISY